MNHKLLLALLALASAGVSFGAGQAWAWQKDPDSTVDPAKVVTSTSAGADVTLGAKTRRSPALAIPSSTGRHDGRSG